jgi:prevent-host-death family protein
MSETRVSIGQVKRDISDLVNRVAYRGERVVLTSRGKPKAVLISIEDYARLQNDSAADDAALSAEILARRKGALLDVDALRRAARADLEARDEQHTGD